MNAPSPHQIQLRGRLSDAILGPYVYEFVISRTATSTILAGQIRDPAHLHGIITHLTSQGVEITGIATIQPTEE